MEEGSNRSSQQPAADGSCSSSNSQGHPADDLIIAKAARKASGGIISAGAVSEAAEAFAQPEKRRRKRKKRKQAPVVAIIDLNEDRAAIDLTEDSDELYGGALSDKDAQPKKRKLSGSGRAGSAPAELSSELPDAGAGAAGIPILAELQTAATVGKATSTGNSGIAAATRASLQVKVSQAGRTLQVTGLVASVSNAAKAQDAPPPAQPAALSAAPVGVTVVPDEEDTHRNAEMHRLLRGAR